MWNTLKTPFHEHRTWTMNIYVWKNTNPLRFYDRLRLKHNILVWMWSNPRTSFMIIIATLFSAPWCFTMVDVCNTTVAVCNMMVDVCNTVWTQFRGHSGVVQPGLWEKRRETGSPENINRHLFKLVTCQLVSQHLAQSLTIQTETGMISTIFWVSRK